MSRIERHGTVEPLTPRFTCFLEKGLGACSVDLFQAPTQERVDYMCFGGLVAIEVKTLEKDASIRISNLANKLKMRSDWPVFYGTWPAHAVLRNLADPDDGQRQMYNAIGRALESHLSKANQQLSTHVATFPRRTTVRLVVVINEDHEVYHPDVVATIITRYLSSGRWDNIDAVLFLSERHAIRAGSGEIVFPLVNIIGPPAYDDRWKEDVILYIMQKWSAWNGASYVQAAPDIIADFSAVDAIPDEMRRQEMWELQYRRDPYMRSWSTAQVLNRWDEATVVFLCRFHKNSPVKPSEGALATNEISFTHLLQEIAHRGIPLTMMDRTPATVIEAAKRIGVPEIGLQWLRDLASGRELDQ